jgi:light-regulated signal transduction histidine kinase (bacteriophytochrome)
MDESKNKIEELNAELQSYKKQLTDFVESAAHDLHAPLRKLSILTEKLVAKHESLFNNEAKEYVKRIQTCIAEMNSLISGLTELASVKVESEAFTECDLNLVVKEILETMSEEIEEKRAVINTDRLPVVRGNKFQYTQLFRNLFENAIKFNKEDISVKIDLTTQLVTAEEKNFFELEKQKKYYRIEMIDNGIGFKQAYAEKIFQPFVRLHARSKYEGSGLGLTICKKIVMNHKGIIYAEGNENKGSLFALILPESP